MSSDPRMGYLAELVAHTLLQETDMDIEEVVTDLFDIAECIRKKPYVFAGLLQGVAEDWLLERKLCPECGCDCESESFVLGVHPYGSTTATEYGSRLACKNDTCGWVEQV